MSLLLILLITGIFLAFYLLLDYLKKSFVLETILTRKIAHVLSGIGVVVFSQYLNRTEYLISTFIFVIVFSFAYRKKLFNSIHIENNLGEILYPISMFLLGYFLYTQREFFVSGVMIVALADTASAITGRKFSNDPNYMFGAFGFWVTAFFLLYFIDDLTLRAFCALMLSLVEYFTIKGWDNLTVPITYILLVFILQF